jgi:hypothetical protein
MPQDLSVWECSVLLLMLQASLHNREEYQDNLESDDCSKQLQDTVLGSFSISWLTREVQGCCHVNDFQSIGNSL